MKIFILTCLLVCTLAEPPVGDGYAAARSGHSHGNDIQRALSQEYGVPEVSTRNQKDYPAVSVRSQTLSSYIPSSRTLSQEYGPPARSSLSQKYGTPNFRSKVSQEYGLPSIRSQPSKDYGVPISGALSQQYGAPDSRTTIFTEYATPLSQSHSYDLPSSRLSQEYGVPQLRSDAQEYSTIGDFPSDSYGTPLQRSPSNLYGQPQFSSTPSEEYGVPSQRSFGQAPSQQYGAPSSRNIQNYNSLPLDSLSKHSTRSRNLQSSFGTRTFSSSFGTPRSPSSQYGLPNAKNADSYLPSSKSISHSYLPSSRAVSQNYGVPNERSLASEYGAPEARTNLRTNVYTSFDKTRSTSSHGKYDARDLMPSDNYGVPDQYSAISNQGYSYARNALDELLNQEPANYDFGYKVSDYESGSDFGHSETRQENKAEGSYFVVLPDGTKQTVEYEADERGFKPRISVEPVEARSGYDDNAADLARSVGPY
ncbi:pro-resilin-like [Melitaea cinxia]|uniref:pro-resilin-like n=1 Tax=Melitaea cinxia TaxID=113334 RepID=UPI001E273C50|nr:pro-resilin-like [Melitaea cinxia]